MTRKKLSILVVSGTYLPDIGGSELSIHTACVGLARRNHKVLVVADDRRPVKYTLEGIPVLACAPQNLDHFLNSIYSKNKFDIIITQLIYSIEALLWAKEKGLPTVYFLRNKEMKIDLSFGTLYSPDMIIANSNFIAKNAKRRWNREVPVIYPFIDLSKIVPLNHKPRFITMFNPILLKGGDLFCQIAQHYPRREFLTINSWTGLRNQKDGSWNHRQWNLISKAHDDPSVHPPKDIDFSNCHNVVCLQSTSNVQEIYEKTRLILFPSRWDEAFGRVILESLASGVPIIVNNVGGVIETGINNGGIIMKKYSTLNDWIDVIELFDDPITYNIYSKAAKEDSKWYSLENELDKLENICLSLTG